MSPARLRTGRGPLGTSPPLFGSCVSIHAAPVLKVQSEPPCPSHSRTAGPMSVPLRSPTSRLAGAFDCWKWSGRRESNPLFLAWKARAFPVGHARVVLVEHVGLDPTQPAFGGFRRGSPRRTRGRSLELSTSFQGRIRQATLSYAPFCPGLSTRSSAGSGHAACPFGEGPWS